MLKQQIPSHQLHKISHKMSPSLNSRHKTKPSPNNNHKMSLSLNSSHNVSPLKNNNHKTKHLTLSCLSPPMMIHHFQIIPQLSKLLLQKIPALYQRNQDIVYNRNKIIFNPFSYFLITDQGKKQTAY